MSQQQFEQISAQTESILSQSAAVLGGYPTQQPVLERMPTPESIEPVVKDIPLTQDAITR